MASNNLTKNTSPKVLVKRQHDVIFQWDKFLDYYHSTLKQTEFQFKLLLAPLPEKNKEEENINQINNSEINLSSGDLDNKISQFAYIALNKIFSYYLIKSKVYECYNIKFPELYVETNSAPLAMQLESNFTMMVDDYEFGPIFRLKPCLTQFELPNDLKKIIIEFIVHLSQVDFSVIKEDEVAELFQQLIPISQRKSMGQIYTPGDIADLMTFLAIRSSNDIVLDPACGCGTLLRKSYEYKNKIALYSKKPKTHSQLLEEIWGVELNDFPAHISMMTLAGMDLSYITHNAGVLIHDFLDMGPIEKYFVKSKDLHTGETKFVEMPAKFDVILANPPYIKQEIIPNKKQMLKNLPIFASYRENASNTLPNNISNFNTSNNTSLPIRSKISKKSNLSKIPKIAFDLTAKTDYYGFFLWYSYYFLRDHGICCFIVPNKWMDVKYGEEIKEFLLNHYKILAIVGFGKNLFRDAQVSTIILILQKERNTTLRTKNITKFIHVLNKDNLTEIKDIVYDNSISDTDPKFGHSHYVFNNKLNQYNCTYIPQKNLDIHDKWSLKYVYQSEFARILEDIPLISMDNNGVTSVVGGIKTGANAFFFPSESERKESNIETQFLVPGIKSGRDIPDQYIVETTSTPFLSIPSNLNITPYPGLTAYIKKGKDHHLYPNRPSIQWDPWYYIPSKNQDCPDILFLRHIDKNFKARWNKLRSIVADGVRGINVLNKEHIYFYLGVCNSTFFYWQAHMLGRWEGQGDLQLLVYELRKFKIPDITLLDSNLRMKVEQAMLAIIETEKNCILKNEVKISEHIIQDLQKNLDLAVLECIGLKAMYSLLMKETQDLQQHRLSKKFEN